MVVVYEVGDLNTSDPGDACRWEMLKTMMMMMSENQTSQSQVHVTVFLGTEG